MGILGEFRASHVMPGMLGPEGRPHSHDYRIEAVVGRDELDDSDMVCDLDLLGSALNAAIERVRDRDLEVIKPPEVAAVTVELLARWAHREIAHGIGGVDGTLSVRVWESPVAFGGYAAPLSSS